MSMCRCDESLPVAHAIQAAVKHVKEPIPMRDAEVGWTVWPSTQVHAFGLGELFLPTRCLLNTKHPAIPTPGRKQRVRELILRCVDQPDPTFSDVPDLLTFSAVDNQDVKNIQHNEKICINRCGSV